MNRSNVYFFSQTPHLKTFESKLFRSGNYLLHVGNPFTGGTYRCRVPENEHKKAGITDWAPEGKIRISKVKENVA